MEKIFSTLKEELSGGIRFDNISKALYATDASVYREIPLGVAYPKSTDDIKLLVQAAKNNNFSLIPRTAGTSLAGQCVGKGLVVDVSKQFNTILEINEKEKWVRVQPGVIRDELNHHLEPLGLFFAPVTSTSNRAMIGGMVGNNSTGTNSISYGSTRDHVISMQVILSDGNETTFKALSKEEFIEKTKLKNLEGELYRQIKEMLDNPHNQKNIEKFFPKATIHRRNTGYALDSLLQSNLFLEQGKDFNFCELLCGSEGTLAFTTEIKLSLNPLPPPYNVVVAAHFNTIYESMKATQVAMQFNPSACELMDKIILDCTKDNLLQRKNRYFIEGDPKAVLLIEFKKETLAKANKKADELIEKMKNSQLGYAFPKIPSPASKKVWELRSAGLGLLANVPGDKKTVACIEDTAVALEDLADYIKEFEEMMKEFGQESVYYAHAGAGEIHLRPILNLKTAQGVKDFYTISKASALLVKKYHGSLSGEHGDGRVRASFIPLVLGEENYELFKSIKKIWDPQNIFNPGKIVDAPPMDTSLRYEKDLTLAPLNTLFDFSKTEGILRMAEKCNGSGDCRKLPFSGGTMCPSYQATRNEKDTTRARANTLREFLTKNQKQGKANPFNSKEIKEVMDLCLACKGCLSECPSNVDVASLKAEFLHQYYKSNKIPLRNYFFSEIFRLNKLGNSFRFFTNFIFKNSWTSYFLKSFLKIAPERSIPLLTGDTFKWYQKNYQKHIPKNPKKTVYLFCDEFTRYNDSLIGIKTIKLLSALDYQVKMIDHQESGRAAISKGFLTKAKKLAEDNVRLFGGIISEKTPLIGIEPSAILSFRDEYPRLVRSNYRPMAEKLKKNALLIDEFLANEIDKGNIDSNKFTENNQEILLHGHCHQKALSSISLTEKLLSLPKNYQVKTISSGCCGMAGSFGYEKEHYAISQQIGELVLFPALRKAKGEVIVSAPGISCRHQIALGTKRSASHPVEIMWEALIK